MRIFKYLKGKGSLPLPVELWEGFLQFHLAKQSKGGGEVCFSEGLLDLIIANFCSVVPPV